MKAEGGRGGVVAGGRGEGSRWTGGRVAGGQGGGGGVAGVPSKTAGKKSQGSRH